MRRNSIAEWARTAQLLAIGVLCFAAVAWADAPATQPTTTTAPAGVDPTCATTAPTTAPAEQVVPQATPTTRPAAEIATEAEQLRKTAIENALAGKFDQALAGLRQAATLAGADSDPAEGLLGGYLDRMQEARAQRKAEYLEAVRRIERSMLAQEYLPTLEEAELAEPLREKVLEVGSDYIEAGNSDALEVAADEEAQQLKADTVKALDDAVAALGEALEMLPTEDGEYVQSFHQAAEVVQKGLEQYRQVWSEVATDTLQGRLDGADRLRDLEEDLTASLGDLEVMISSRPWRVGLLQAQLAKELYCGDGAVKDEDWYARITTIGEQQGRQAVEDDRWFDAMGAYVALGELDPDNEHYKERSKTIRRHVRVLGLYTSETPQDQDEELAAAEEESGEAVEEDEEGESADGEETSINWREIVAGVDANMIRNAISQMEQYYVVAVDYRKVGLGALNSIEVLAETDQAAESFPGLADAEKKQKFLADVAAVREYLDKKDRLDHIDLQTAFNSVLRASDRTVEIPLEVLAVEFTEGMLDELDKFSSMIWPYDVSDFQKQTMGKFFGVGIQITKEPGEPLKVVSPLPGSPAHRQGIKTDDLIMAVDGRRTEDLSVDKLVRMITGEKGTTVVLSIKRPGMIKSKDYTIVREEIRIRTVKGWRQLPDGDWDYMIDADHGIGYIRITQFTDQTAGDVDEALEKLKAAGLRSLILDLRWNPGGLMRPATRVADEFLPGGKVVSTKGRPTPPSEIDAGPGGRFLDGDMIVLVNQYSASAAEIVSGALTDWHRALIVGERTFGKGSVQNVIPIPYKDAFLKLTTAYYYLPSGRLLHRQNGSTDWGVHPDVKVVLTPKQIKRWLDIRRKTDLIQDIDPDELTSELADQLDADLQLQTALLMLRLQQLQPDLREESNPVVPQMAGPAR